MANAKQTPVQARQAQAAAAINGSKSKAAPASAPTKAAPVVKSAKLAVAEKWTTVTVTAATPAFRPNRATPMDIAYDAARINGAAILKLDGKARSRRQVGCHPAAPKAAAPGSWRSSSAPPELLDCPAPIGGE